MPSYHFTAELLLLKLSGRFRKKPTRGQEDSNFASWWDDSRQLPHAIIGLITYCQTSLIPVQ